MDNQLPHQDKVERVARAMCRACGTDPDHPAVIGELPALPGRPNVHLIPEGAILPAWEVFARDSAAAVEAMEGQP